MIDWSQTKAVIQREGHIYLNLIGRTDHGIVDPKDQYELEEEIRAFCQMFDKLVFL